MAAGPEARPRDAARPTGLSRLRGPGARRVGAGLADQVVIALANAGNSLLALLLVMPRERAGVLALSLVVGLVVVSLNRAFVGEVLLALAPRFAGAPHERLIRNGLTAALTFGALSAVVLGGVWMGTAAPGGTDLPDLIWVAAVLPIVLLHDTARYSYLADRHPARALVIDLTYVAMQGLVVVFLVLTDQVTPATLVFAWGLGAAAGFTLYASRTRRAPWGGNPREWLTQTRVLSGWFTATAVIAQFQVLAVNMIIDARLSPHAVAGYRFAQTTVLQPVQNFNQAIMSLLVPRISRLAGVADSDGDSTAAARLRRDVPRTAALLACLAIIVIAAGGMLAQLVLPLIEDYADIAPVAWPLLIQGGIYMVQAPFTSAVRGMHRARMQLLQYVIFTTSSLVGLVVGADGWGLVGAAWGLAAGSVIGLITTVLFYFYALRFLGTPRGRVDDEADAAPPPPLS
jgi:O-antigen/teichoic acid export membrane protein